jgi:putative ABC transport system ATP-binding protein
MLKLENVTKTYSNGKRIVSAIRDVSLSILPGELVAVQGPSGCGKSTMLLVSGALLRPTSGTVRVADCDPYQLNVNQRSKFRAQHIGFVFQQFHLIPYLNVLQNVLTADLPLPQPEPQKRATELIEQFGLADRREHLPAELSVGEKQRLALARAIFSRPRLLLADEPTGNLDPQNGRIVLEALRNYADEGAAVVIVTHDPQVTEGAQRVEQLEQGMLRAEGKGAAFTAD